MLLTYKQLETAYKRAEEYEDRDEFVRAYLEEIGQITDDGKADIEMIDQLRSVYRNTHITIEDLKEMSGLSYTDLARRFGIGIKRMQAWLDPGREVKPPRTMLQFMLAAIEHRPFDNYPIVKDRRYHPEVSTNWQGKHKARYKQPDPDLIDIDQDLD